MVRNRVGLWYAFYRMKSRIHCPDLHVIGKEMMNWYAGPLGQRLASMEQEELDKILPNLFGYHLLQVGEGGHNLLSASRILHRVVLSSEPGVGQENIRVKGEPGALPFLSDSIDAVILYHALEFSRDPHQVLREAERLLIPEGHMVIIGFNPQSLWGMTRLFRFRSKHFPWCGRFISTLRIRDWLSLLGFEVLVSRHRFFMPPVQRSGVLDRLGFMEKPGGKWWPILGGVYVLLARKRVSTVTPIKPRWRPRRSVDSVLGDAASRSIE